MWVKDGSWAQSGDGFVLLQRLTHRTRAKRIIFGERGTRQVCFMEGGETVKLGSVVGSSVTHEILLR